MPNQYKNKVVYGGSVLIDITDTTATAEDVAQGKYFYAASGEKMLGTAVAGGAITVVETPDPHGGTIVTITGDEVKLQSKTATPTKSQQTIQPDQNYTGLAYVTVEPIPANYIEPSGDKTINQNGSNIDVAEYATVTVNVQSESANLQAKTGIAPTESSQTITPDTGYDGLSSVQINAISSTYVGSGIPRRDLSNIVQYANDVVIPGGYYSSSEMHFGLEGGEIANPTTNITINPTMSVDSSTGVVSASLYTFQPVTPELVSVGYFDENTGTLTSAFVNVEGSNTLQLTTQAASTITPTKSSQTAVASGVYTTGAVTVAAIPAEYITTTDATASAADIVSGETAYVNGSKMTGSLVIQHYYTGSTDPSASLGVDGDIYLQTS